MKATRLTSLGIVAVNAAVGCKQGAHPMRRKMITFHAVLAMLATSALLAAALVSLRRAPEVRRVVVAVCDSSQIEGRKEVGSGDLPGVLQSDFEESAPPDRIYVVE